MFVGLMMVEEEEIEKGETRSLFTFCYHCQTRQRHERDIHSPMIRKRRHHTLSYHLSWAKTSLRSSPDCAEDNKYKEQHIAGVFAIPRDGVGGWEEM